MRSVLAFVVVTAVLAGWVGLAQAGQDHARGSAYTELVHDGQENVSGNKWRFYGHLESKNEVCLPDRTVKMFKKKDGEWVFVDKDKTNGAGNYTTAGRLPSEPPLKFTVKKKEVGPVTCGGDSIKPFSGPTG